MTALFTIVSTVVFIILFRYLLSCGESRMNPQAEPRIAGILTCRRHGHTHIVMFVGCTEREAQIALMRSVMRIEDEECEGANRVTDFA